MTHRLNAKRIITLNCGVGRDSITMMALLFEGRLYSEVLGGIVLPEDLDCIVFSDTGAEWPHTYALVERLRELATDHGVRFLVLRKGELDTSCDIASWADIEAKAELGGYHRRVGIMEDFESRATVASLGKGDCTDNHKIQPIRRLLSDISKLRFGRNNRSYSHAVRKGERKPHVTIIGIAADETSRLDNGGKGPAYVTESYPLVDMGIPKTGEAPILERWGLNHVRKSGCFMCPYQPAGWYWALRETEPEVWDNVVAYEAHALARNPRMAVTGHKRPDKTPMTLPEVVERWRAANPDATVEAVLSKEYTRCTKDARKNLRSELAGSEKVVPVDSLVRKVA